MLCYFFVERVLSIFQLNNEILRLAVYNNKKLTSPLHFQLYTRKWEVGTKTGLLYSIFNGFEGKRCLFDNYLDSKLFLSREHTMILQLKLKLKTEH